MGEKGLIELKNNFADPDYIIKHKVSNKLELIYSQKDYKNRTVYCIVILNTNAKHYAEKIDVHVMTTAYGKSKIEEYIEKSIKEKRLIYSKEESLNSDSYVRYEGYAKSDSSSINRIHDFDAKSNSNIKKLERDAVYLEAVKNGDMKTAQRLVDEAAKKAGYTVKGYHGSRNKFTMFDKNRIGQGNDQYGSGFYFSSNAESAQYYGDVNYSSYLKLNNPIELDGEEQGRSVFGYNFSPKQAYEILKLHPDIYAVYKLENYDYNIHDNQTDATKIILELQKGGYNEKQTRTILQNYTSVYGTIFKRYNSKSRRFVKLTRESASIREDNRKESVRTGTLGVIGEEFSDSGVKLYQARPDISDMFFDDSDELSDNDAFLVGEYLRNNKDSNVAYHSSNNTVIFATD